MPGLGGLLRSLRRDTPPEVQVGRLLSLCCADPGRVPAWTVAQHVEMERRRQDIPNRGQAIITASRSVVRLAGHRRGRTYRAILDKVGCPVLLLQGDRDRLVPVAAARAAAGAHPSWTLEVLPGVGHVPQLEVPEETARLITGWLGGDGRDGRAGAGRAGAYAQPRPLRAVFRTAGQKVSRALSRSRPSGRD
jgi:pimeloyl-ACP methyl ester carboxylesterase